LISVSTITTISITLPLCNIIVDTNTIAELLILIVIVPVDTSYCRIFLHIKPPCWVEGVCHIFNHGLHVCTYGQ